MEEQRRLIVHAIDRAEIAIDGALNNVINCISYSRKLLVMLAN